MVLLRRLGLALVFYYLRPRRVPKTLLKGNPEMSEKTLYEW
jgi:hypothetical protein